MMLSLKPIPEQQDYIAPMPSTSTTKKNDRLNYLTNLKAFLTALVILHHTAIAYGGAGQLVYHSVAHPPGSELTLVAFNAINQTFFMALFFLIAGFLSRRSLMRRKEKDGWAGVGRFVRDRVWRLGIPTAVYSLSGPALCKLVVAMVRGEDASGTEVWADISDVQGIKGPVWFCALLLLFDLLLAAIWTIKNTTLNHNPLPGTPIKPTAHDTQEPESPTNINGPQLLTLLTILTLTDFTWRLIFPAGTIFIPLNLNLGYLPQYIAAYTFGLVASCLSYAIPGTRTLVSLVVASAVSGMALGCSMSSRFGLDISSDPTSGGLNILAAAYAMWNNFTGYLIGSGLLHLFLQHINTSHPAITSLSYPAFLLHIPISTAIEVSLESWEAAPVTKTAVVGTANIVASWTTAWTWQSSVSALQDMIATTSPAVAQSHISSACQKPRRRTPPKAERAIEILEGLDEVGR